MAISSVKVTINGTTHTLTDNGDGTYSKTIAAPNKTSYNVNEGHYYPVTVTATNQAGTSTTANDSHATLGSKLRLVVKETSAPTITVTQPTSNQYFATATPTFKFTITDEANGSGITIGSVALVIDLDSTNELSYFGVDSAFKFTQITNGYSVEFTCPKALADGTHTLSIAAADNDGNTATISEISFTTDTVAPVLSVTNPSTNGTYVANSALNVTGTVSDSTSGVPTVKITLNGSDVGSVTVSNGAFSKSVTLNSGSNTIVVTATDKAGKTTTITRTITLDTSSPVIASVSITPNPVNVGANYTVTVTVE